MGWKVIYFVRRTLYLPKGWRIYKGMYISFKSETTFFLKVTFSGKLHLSVTFDYISKFPLKLNELPWSEAPWTVVWWSQSVTVEHLQCQRCLGCWFWVPGSWLAGLGVLENVIWGLQRMRDVRFFTAGLGIELGFWYLWSSELLVVQKYSSNLFKIHSSFCWWVITSCIQMHLLIIYFHLHHKKAKGSGKSWDTDFFFFTCRKTFYSAKLHVKISESWICLLKEWVLHFFILICNG